MAYEVQAEQGQEDAVRRGEERSRAGVRAVAGEEEGRLGVVGGVGQWQPVLLRMPGGIQRCSHASGAMVVVKSAKGACCIEVA